MNTALQLVLIHGVCWQVTWKNTTSDQNSWLTRDVLEEMGFTKLVNDIDAKEAARMGLVTRCACCACCVFCQADLGCSRKCAGCWKAPLR